MRRFLNAAEAREIVFVRGATEAINLVAATFGRAHVQAGDEIVVSEMEHHSNIVPWQMLCEEKGARLRVIPITDAGELRLDEYERLLGARTRIVAVTHVSNALGTINPVDQIVRLAHDRGIAVLIDGAQAVAHMPVDVQAIGCDFYVFSGHKIFGPTGIGVLYGRAPLLDAMPPYQGGGDMIRSVTFERTLYNDVPYKFEAGTPNIAGAVGLAAAMDYLTTVGLESGRGRGARAAGVRHQRARGDSRPAAHRYGAAQGRHSLVRHGRGAPARHRHDPGSRRRGHSCRSPLLSAADGEARGARDRPGIAGALQHARGHRRAGGGDAQGAGGFHVSDDDLQDLYQEVILDHNRRPRNYRVLDGARTAEGFNPLCGDRLSVYVRIDDGVISDVSFQGSGCAISKASASLMTESIKGKTIAEADLLFDQFQHMITAPTGSPVDRLGKLTALAGVRQFPIRVKCASLAWHTLRAAMNARDEVVSTE